MNKITFGKNTTINLSSSHHDIWNTNKLNFSNKFEPVKYLDKDDKVKVGNRYKQRQVNIMQFSEQKWNQKGRNDMNPVELRLGYMKSNQMDKKDNFGYQRDDLTKRNSNEKSRNFVFNSKPKSSVFNPFEKTQKSSVFNPFEKPKNVESPFKFDKTPASPFKFETTKTSPFKFTQTTHSTFKFGEITNNSKLDKSTTFPFKFETPKSSPFKLGQTNTFKFGELPNNSKPTAIKDCFLGLKNPTQINFPKNTIPFKTSTETQTQPIKKPAENPDTSLILEHCKLKIAKEIELNNSIEYDLQNNPYPADSFSVTNSSPALIQQEKPNHSIDRNLSSVAKKFLFSPVKSKSDLMKPRVKNSKPKTNENQIKPAVKKILIKNIKVKVVNV